MLDRLIEQYKEMHEGDSVFPGDSLSQHGASIKQIIDISDSKTLLDFGCGKGYQYTKMNLHKEYFNNIMPSLYDPGTKYSDFPEGMFDGVICTDVLEHIEEEDLDEVLGQIFSKANKFVYLGVCTIPALAILPDGRNAHVTIKPFQWWLDKVLPFSKTATQLYCYGDAKCVARMENNNIYFRKER
jgi:hypothetical protein